MYNSDSISAKQEAKRPREAKLGQGKPSAGESKTGPPSSKPGAREPKEGASQAHDEDSDDTWSEGEIVMKGVQDDLDEVRGEPNVQEWVNECST